MKRSKKVLLIIAILVLTLSIVYFIPESRKGINTRHFTLALGSYQCV
jgi:hypothetical protein